ncbi:MAG TPA: S53 family peptidase [Solirubrobacteraceae bacterium]|nr:S53 family peptidase [Solirubrobacteraceae bacterium]
MLRRWTIPLLAATGTLAGALTGGPAARAAVVGAGAGAGKRALVQRAAAVPAGATIRGALAPSAPVQLTVALAPSDPAALAGYAQQVSDPSSPLYRHYLSVAQFAARFGAGAAEVASVRSALTQAGVSVGAVASNGLSLSASGTAAEIDDAFGTALERVTLPDGTSAYADVTNPTLPAAAAAAVQAVAGLDTLPAAAPQGLRRAPAASARAAARPRSTTSAAGPSSCSSENAAGGYTAAEIGSAYGMDGQWNAGNLGAGSTVALVELAPYHASDVSSYQTCDGTSAQVSNIAVDGGAANCWRSGPNYDPECGLEDVLDIEDVAGLAPGATIDVYEGPNTIAGLLDVYRAIVQADAPIVSTSWGACEAAAGTSLLSAENTLFEEAAVQGEAVFAAAGDNGADDCGNGTRSVDDPASQPYVTGVGGTTMTSSSPGIPETVWNDSSYGGGAGGGGVSRQWASPSYQSAVAIPQNTISCSGTPGGGTTSTSCREVPDVSADADPNTGYNILWNGQWLLAGGTSAAAPTWAALVALADSSSACTTNQVRVGFANAVLYGLPSTDFLDVTSGNNTDGVSGYAARGGYDMASGLGAPAGAALIPALCATTRTVTASPTTTTTQTTTPATTTPPTNPTTPAPAPTTPAPAPTTPVPTRRSGSGDRAPVVRFAARRRRRVVRLGRRVRIVFRARDRAGLRLRYFARRLPAGLWINRRTGVIGGRPRRPGRRVSRITARDRRGHAETIVVRWTVVRG